METGGGGADARKPAAEGWAKTPANNRYRKRTGDATQPITDGKGAADNGEGKLPVGRRYHRRLGAFRDWAKETASTKVAEKTRNLPGQSKFAA